MNARRERVARWVDTFGGELYTYACTLTSSEEDARDLVQEAWMLILDAPDALPPDEDARAWIYAIASRLALHRLRTEQRRNRVLERFADDLPGPQGWKLPDLDRLALARSVLGEINALPDLQRRVLYARLVEGRSVKETAEALGRATGTIKGSLNRGVAALRERLGTDLEAALRRAPLRARDPRDSVGGSDPPDPPDTSAESPPRNGTPNGASR
ncbi:MAG: RNA polymerase sigma factor, partial [Longimicrobiales bacterium]|nr:RNA polymerase sigma factor [Longimicrobiales bacterium]